LIIPSFLINTIEVAKTQLPLKLFYG
jgi:hypothetical protein